MAVKLVMVPPDIGLEKPSAIKPQMHWVGTPVANKQFREFATLSPSLENERVTRVNAHRFARSFSDLDLFTPSEFAAQRLRIEPLAARL